MLIKCPECELPVSTKALNCPHCGYPITNNKPKNTKHKHMRLPNGFGQISEIKNRNLRKPFRAMITVGKNNNGRPICKLLKPNAYFRTYNEAYQALMEFNKNPFDITENITMDELFERWLKSFLKDKKNPKAAKSGVIGPWRFCSSIKHMIVKDVRVRHLKTCVENAANSSGPASANAKYRIKTLLNSMYDYAVEYDIVSVNYARQFSLSKNINKQRTDDAKQHISYSDDELKILWNNVADDVVCYTIIQCYTGWRPREFLALKLEDIDLDNWTMTGGMKTKNGKNRVVPIHPGVRHLVLDKYRTSENNGSKFFVSLPSTDGRIPIQQVAYNRFYRHIVRMVDKYNLNPDHKPHDARKTFVTLAKKYKVDEYAIKYMVGHSISDITEKIYTDRNLEWLTEELEKISV